MFGACMCTPYILMLSSSAGCSFLDSPSISRRLNGTRVNVKSVLAQIVP